MSRTWHHRLKHKYNLTWIEVLEDKIQDNRAYRVYRVIATMLQELNIVNKEEYIEYVRQIIEYASQVDYYFYIEHKIKNNAISAITSDEIRVPSKQSIKHLNLPSDIQYKINELYKFRTDFIYYLGLIKEYFKDYDCNIETKYTSTVINRNTNIQYKSSKGSRYYEQLIEIKNLKQEFNIANGENLFDLCSLGEIEGKLFEYFNITKENCNKETVNVIDEYYFQFEEITEFNNKTEYDEKVKRQQSNKHSFKSDITVLTLNFDSLFYNLPDIIKPLYNVNRYLKPVKIKDNSGKHIVKDYTLNHWLINKSKINAYDIKKNRRELKSKIKDRKRFRRFNHKLNLYLTSETDKLNELTYDTPESSDRSIGTPINYKRPRKPKYSKKNKHVTYHKAIQMKNKITNSPKLQHKLLSFRHDSKTYQLFDYKYRKHTKEYYRIKDYKYQQEEYLNEINYYHSTINYHKLYD